MDHWILAATHSLIKFVMEEMAAYRLYTVVPRLVKLIDDLTNWYVRLNRRRLKGENGVTNCLASLQTLFEVLMLLTRMMSPFTPFLTEYFWQNLRRAMPGGSDDANADASKQDTRSVHFMMFPQPTQSYFDTDIVRYAPKQSFGPGVGHVYGTDGHGKGGKEARIGGMSILLPFMHFFDYPVALLPVLIFPFFSQRDERDAARD